MKVVKITLRLPKILCDVLRREANRIGISLNGIIIELLRAGLKSKRHAPISHQDRKNWSVISVPRGELMERTELKDFWCLSVNRKDSLYMLFGPEGILRPYIKHPKKRQGMEAVLRNIEERNKRAKKYKEGGSSYEWT
jgi:hypothetical protein